MSLDRTIVIELGSPEGLDSRGLCPLADRVQHAVMSGLKVIAVVRGPDWRETRDVAASERLGASADVHARAMVVGSGAFEAAERLAGFLLDRGVSTARLDAERAVPVTRGHALDAQPRHVSARYYTKALAEHDVIVVPGGVGIDEDGRGTHLGESGSVLSALFLADVFGVELRVAEPLFASAGTDSIGGRKVRLFMSRHRLRVAGGGVGSQVEPQRGGRERVPQRA